MEKQMKIIKPVVMQPNIKVKKQNSLSIALAMSFAIALLIGIAYGISLYMFETNIALFPIMGTLAVSYVYNRNCDKGCFSLWVRPLLGMISSLQIIVGFLVCELLLTEIPLYPINIYLIVREYARYTLENPANQAVLIFLLLVCFIYGVMQDYAFRLPMLLKKSIMRKWGKYYCKREGRMFSIYLIDPVKFNENEKGRLIAYITEGCYIEKSVNKVKAFYLLKEDMDEAAINIGSNSIREIENREYYQIDLGGEGEMQKYLQPCALIMDGNQNVEVIQIEI